MRRAIYAFVGGLVVASCIVPNYEVDDSVDGGSGEGGESGTSTGGSTNGGGTNGGSTNGGSTNGGSTNGGSTNGGSTNGGSTNGGSTTGGTAGQGGDAPMGGTAGDGGAGTGGGCLTGLTECDGECFNLETDGEHCGDCDTDCATGEVCLEGSCETDCGTLTECGTSCVDTDTDEMHCGDCGTPCLGTCVGGDCDLSCPDSRLRCGAVCCALPPANGIVSCPQNQCLFSCATNYNDCNPDPAVTECYASNDVAHCGTSCLDCRQPNATATCTSGGACSNTCIGSALTCAPVNGKPSCGTWDFESGTTEGWSVWDVDPANIPTAADGALTTRTQEATSGSRSLAVHFNGNGTDRFAIYFKLRLCDSGQAIDMSNKVLTFDILAETDSGTLPFTSADGHNYFQLYNGTTSIIGIMDFDMASDDIFQRHKCQVYPDTAAITDIVFLFRVFKPWTGWVYIDNAKIEECNPTLCP
jgi:hypothetical protein